MVGLCPELCLVMNAVLGINGWLVHHVHNRMFKSLPDCRF